MSRSRLGFSMLLECLVGIGIFAVAVLMAMGLYPAAHGALTQAKQMNVATQLSHQVMEQALSRGWDAVVDIPPGPSTEFVYPMQQEGRDINLRYQYEVDVQGPASGSKLKKILVTVRWTQGKHKRSVFVESYKVPY
jgi:type II secretory pathway pseudopilin PulG